MKKCFVEHKFNPGSLALIEVANAILEEYETQGLVLTLRQLFYQFVSRDKLPNKQNEYKRLGSLISNARLAGLVDWEMMEDRTRQVQSVSAWKDPASILGTVAEQYKEDLWASQSHHVEVWIEKEALVGVIERACEDLRVNYFACRGYASQSAHYEAGQRFTQYRRRGQTPIILYLGDHDPSGLDMTRDNRERISLFVGRPVEVIRLALNSDQIETYEPPPNPAKETDSRSADYMANHGNESWELDALEPRVIDKLIRDNVATYINQSDWDSAEEQEASNRARLVSVSERWESVETFLSESEDI